MMKAEIFYNSSSFSVDLSQPTSLSLAIRRDTCNPNAYFLPAAEFEVFRVPGFVGSVPEGGPCNCELVRLSPHGNGTHTECVGHISAEPHYIADCLRHPLTIARLCTVQPSVLSNGDSVISVDAVRQALDGFKGQSLILRSQNSDSLSERQWSGSNPCYCEAGVGRVLREHGILNFLLDLPSVDRESDGGLLQVHHEFWNYPESPRTDATITEMIVVPDSLADAEYLLSIGIPPLHSDAAPSQCLVYALNAEGSR